MDILRIFCVYSMQEATVAFSDKCWKFLIWSETFQQLSEILISGRDCLSIQGALINYLFVTIKKNRFFDNPEKKKKKFEKNIYFLFSILMCFLIFRKNKNPN